MFANKTYEGLLSDMLSRVKSDVDKREGSVIYDALAPCAYELAQTYYNLDHFLDLVFGDTSVGEYLDRVVADYGITRKAETYAIRQIETNGSVGIGTRWGLNDTTYKVTGLISPNVYRAICEQPGDIGNGYSGTLENIDNINGIAAVLTDIITAGTEKETDDKLRERFYMRVQAPSTSGNADNYKEWALDVPGVGKAKVIPLWRGAGTVKVLVVDSDMAIDETLPDSVTPYIEAVRPIGAEVTVESPSGLTIDVSANVLLDGSQDFAVVQAAFVASVEEYLKSTVFDTYSISYARVGSLLLDTAGVKDYDLLRINGGTGNIIIEDKYIPVAGMISLTEAE